MHTGSFIESFASSIDFYDKILVFLLCETISNVMRLQFVIRFCFAFQNHFHFECSEIVVKICLEYMDSIDCKTVALCHENLLSP